MCFWGRAKIEKIGWPHCLDGCQTWTVFPPRLQRGSSRVRTRGRISSSSFVCFFYPENVMTSVIGPTLTSSYKRKMFHEAEEEQLEPRPWLFIDHVTVEVTDVADRYVVGTRKSCVSESEMSFLAKMKRQKRWLSGKENTPCLYQVLFDFSWNCLLTVIIYICA